MTQIASDKATQLRARTDRQLMKLIDRALDRALHTEGSDAGAVHTAAEGLLQVAYGATYAERRRVEQKLERLAARRGRVFASCA